VTYLTQCHGESTVEETIFEGRFKYVHDLLEMGANIEVIDGNKALIKGPSILQKNDERELTAHDIRAGFAIVLACLVAKGNSTINNIHLIDRGYESLEKRLQMIGVNIKRI
jgi:UDP-N-acetylglucosamine 1-carboxyvinyltransferase